MSTGTVEREQKREREQDAADAREEIERRLGDGGGCAELMDALAAIREEQGEASE